MSVSRDTVSSSKNSQVKSEIITLRGTVDEINKCLSLLSDKLSSILVHKLSPIEEDNVSKTSMPLVPLAMEIKSIRDEAVKAIETIQSMINGCEL